MQTSLEVAIVPLVEAHAADLARTLERNREYLRPWNPLLPDGYFTAAWQLDRIRRLRASGTSHAFVVEGAGAVCGTVTLSNAVLGAWRSCNIGYWIAEHAAGRGVATEAVRQACDYAFDVVRLHRIEAGTLPWNTASQRVLAKNGFDRFGYAPNYLEIEGRWQDHVLFQRLAYPESTISH